MLQNSHGATLSSLHTNVHESWWHAPPIHIAPSCSDSTLRQMWTTGRTVDLAAVFLIFRSKHHAEHRSSCNGPQCLSSVVSSRFLPVTCALVQAMRQTSAAYRISDHIKHDRDTMTQVILEPIWLWKVRSNCIQSVEISWLRMISGYNSSKIAHHAFRETSSRSQMCAMPNSQSVCIRTRITSSYTCQLPQLKSYQSAWDVWGRILQTLKNQDHL